VNRGKGRALKTAFSYFIEHYSYLDGVVTADADGQHAVDDICRICERLSQKHDSLILGVRDFKQDNVPKRSFIGNTVTSRIFQLLYGSYLNDTQTGLRGIPSNEVIWMAKMEGERYDYEINMLIKARHHNLGFLTIPIKTLYFDNNSGSHYSTLKDSARIFLRLISGLIQFSASTTVSAFVDVISFFLLNTILLAGLSAPIRILVSTVIARVISSISNYFMNRRLVFTHTGRFASSAARYYVLCIFLMIASYGMVYTISLFWKVNESLIKLITDFALGFMSYEIQLHWVFRNKDSTEAVLPSNAIGRSR
jgi:putative flippase GtrA